MPWVIWTSRLPALQMELQLSRWISRSRALPTKLWRGPWNRPATDACSSWRRRSEEHTSELQSHLNLVCRLLLQKKKERQSNNELDERLYVVQVITEDYY